MLMNFPFEGDYPIIQIFGDNPQRYAQLSCGGVCQRGHNGIDYALPYGTAVLAVANGVVLAANSDPAGFGQFIVLGHPWGQSFYAHLSQIHVQKGEQVGGGQLLGLSGDSGLCIAPHLHFGMRIIPFSLADGWCGYTDPAPYLKRLDVPRGAILGPHIIGNVTSQIDNLVKWQPRLITVLDPNPDEMRVLRQACPQAVIVGRPFAADHEVQARIRADPVEAAHWSHDLVAARLTPDVDYWQFANEILQDTAGLPLLNQFELARMALAEQKGYKCALFAFSVGNPDLPKADRMALWRLIYPAIQHAEQQGHVIAVHQYGMPNLWGPDNAYDWYIHRLEHQVLRCLPYKKVQFVVTEFGLDGLILGTQPAGWQTFTDAAGYTQELLKCGRYLERFSGRVLGYTVFTLGHFTPWDTYDITGDVVTMLARQSQHGTWKDINTLVTDIIPQTTDVTPDPGGEAIDHKVTDQGSSGDGGNMPVSGGSTGSGAGGTDAGTAPSKPLVERRLVDSFKTYHMEIKTINERPDKPAGSVVYLVKDIFMTANGSWEPSAVPVAAPDWARQAYLTAQFSEAGADHHLFAAVIGVDGQLTKAVDIIYWSDGFDRLDDPSYSGYIHEKTKDSSGWANMFMGAGSSFAPERGESGPWSWAPASAAEVVVGGGLPSGHPVSTFVVWQAVSWDDWKQHNDGPANPPNGGGTGGADGGSTGNGGDISSGPGDGSSTGSGGGTTVSPVAIQRRLSKWIQVYNMSVKSLDQRPDHPQGDTTYLVKDMFTTRDGSWEPSDVPGSVPQWARDAYLKPVDAPDYFADAGGDHHLFAAVIGLDGQLVRPKKIVYWSDGFGELGNPNYTGFVQRETDQRSGWANIVSGPGSNFIPERGESGPWCWAPDGAAEVVCGGGMPAKNHISMFVVWQAVKRSDGTGGDNKPGSETDHSIFLPSVSGDVAAGTLPADFDPSLDIVATISLRGAAWNRLGIEVKPDSVLAGHARDHGLGMPVTQEFEIVGYLVQGYQRGIVYFRLGKWNQIGHLDW